MIVVLDLDDDDVEAVVEKLNGLPRRPLRLHVLTEGTANAWRIRRVLDWFGTPPQQRES